MSSPLLPPADLNDSPTAQPVVAAGSRDALFSQLVGSQPVSINPLPNGSEQVHAELQTALARANAAENEAANIAAIVELTSLIMTRPSTEAAYRHLAEQLHRRLSANSITIGRCEAERRLCVTQATEQPEIRLPEAELTGVLQECVARSAPGICPTTAASERHALLAHQQLQQHKSVEAVVSCPLTNDAGQITGAVVATFDNASLAATAMKFLQASSTAFAAALAANERSTQTWWQRAQASFKQLAAKRASTIVAGAIACSAVALCLPVDYRITAGIELQPVSRRYVAAPFDASLETCLVEPGDVVENGQLLAELNGRELRFEIAGLQAEVATAKKERNGYLSDREAGLAEIARHEVQLHQNKLNMLQHRGSQLEVHSPINGVVVAGDLRHQEGVPLEAGTTMFEVAPLDRMVIEVAIPEADLEQASFGQTVRVRLDAAPDEIIEAKILRIAPAAEVRDHENVFLAEAEIDNVDLTLRPGMKGQGKVSTGYHTLGWNLFHKPAANLMGWLGW